MSAHQMPLVISVILNTNRREDTLECLRSLDRSDYSRHQALVLDNGSTDGSVEAITAEFPDVDIISLQNNRGYAGNNNVGIQAAMDRGADWVFVLNEDVVISEDAISSLIREAENDPHVGILGPMVYHHDSPEVIQSAGGILGPNWSASHRGENEVDQGQYAESEQVDWISGCAILVRRAVIEEVGSLDERFFYYWEETEWCTRARAEGWEILFVPSARIWHKGVQQDYHPSANTTYYWARNWLLFLSTHNAPIRAKTFTLQRLLRTLVSWTLKPRWQGKRDHRDALWQGLRDFVFRRWGMRAIR